MGHNYRGKCDKEDFEKNDGLGWDTDTVLVLAVSDTRYAPGLCVVYTSKSPPKVPYIRAELIASLPRDQARSSRAWSTMTSHATSRELDVSVETLIMGHSNLFLSLLCQSTTDKCIMG